MGVTSPRGWLRIASPALICSLCLSATLAPDVFAAQAKQKDFVGKADQRRDHLGMYAFESGAYRISTDVDKALANDIAAHMDAVYREYATRLAGFKPNPYAAVKPDQRMPLYVLRKYSDYLELLSGFGHNVANTGGVFFRGERQSGLATWVEGQSRLRMYYVLQHEGFHQFADARIMSNLPQWVNEGLAEYFADAMMVDGRLFIGRLDRERIERVRNAVRKGETIAFSRLMMMDNESWNARVNAGDASASLMYDTAWSVCYFLIHGGKGGKPLRTRDGPALEQYLLLMNAAFIKNPRNDPNPQAFAKIFSNDLAEFERQWKRGLEGLEPDPWLSSVRHLQTIAVALRALQEHKVEVESWPQLKEYLARMKFRALIRPRDARGQRGQQADNEGEPAAEAQSYDFPQPADVQFIPGGDPKLPPSMRITNVTPNIILNWSVGADGAPEEVITFRDPPRIAPPVGKKPAKPKS